MTSLSLIFKQFIEIILPSSFFLLANDIEFKSNFGQSFEFLHHFRGAVFFSFLPVSVLCAYRFCPPSEVAEKTVTWTNFQMTHFGTVGQQLLDTCIARDIGNGHIIVRHSMLWRPELAAQCNQLLNSLLIEILPCPAIAEGHIFRLQSVEPIVKFQGLGVVVYGELVRGRHIQISMYQLVFLDLRNAVLPIAVPHKACVSEVWSRGGFEFEPDLFQFLGSTIQELGIVLGPLPPLSVNPFADFVFSRNAGMAMFFDEFLERFEILLPRPRHKPPRKSQVIQHSYPLLGKKFRIHYPVPLVIFHVSLSRRFFNESSLASQSVDPVA
mmetsp:Transcript_2523/g.5239  ORF Transcript_2523/g.5239 Transcript_2523/m.5239 type:complete len:325 (+) Transcript_2523:704-1678(+)